MIEFCRSALTPVFTTVPMMIPTTRVKSSSAKLNSLGCFILLTNGIARRPTRGGNYSIEKLRLSGLGKVLSLTCYC
jgi:hypothetical protein